MFYTSGSPYGLMIVGVLFIIAGIILIFWVEYRPQILYPDPRHHFYHNRHLSQKILPTPPRNQKLVWPLPLRSGQ